MEDQKIETDVRFFVRERYGSLAAESEAEASSCCGPDCDCASDELAIGSTLYSADELESLPSAAANLSLGCGSPVAIASLEPGQVVVDLGSGGGIDCFLAAQQVGLEGRVIGVDMTPNMIDTARRNQASMGLENVEFRLGEIEHLPLADASSDVVISNCVINLSPDKAQVLNEAYRVLRPGGRVAFSDVVASEPLSAELKADVEAWSCCLGGALETQEFIDLLHAAGFEDVDISEVELEGDQPKPQTQTNPVYQAYIAAYKPE